MASELPVLRDDHGRKVVIGAPEPGTVTVNITCGMTSALASFPGERLAIVREAIDRAAMPGQGRADGEAPAAGARDA
jgi:hypothetical protein